MICERCVIADRPWTRLRGLLGKHQLEGDEGMILMPARSIHTCFMRFPIDVVLLDAQGKVLRVRPRLAPWRTASARGARAVLELAPGESERRGLAVGERLTVREGRSGTPAPPPSSARRR